MYISKMTNDVGAEILAGVIRGNPVSTKSRWLMLYQMYVSYVLAAMTCGAVLSLASLRIADHVDDADIKRLAYVAAMLGALASISWLLNGLSWFIHYRSVLRQVESS
jgi:hypothetical protein